MNTNILKKCVEELNAKEPNISYIKGMLETLIELSNIPHGLGGIVTMSTATTPGYAKSDEETEQDQLARKYVGGPVADLS